MAVSIPLILIPFSAGLRDQLNLSVYSDIVSTDQMKF